MFNNQLSEFYFHKRDDLDPMVLADVEEIVCSMNKHAQALWERTHWVTMDIEADDKSAELHKYRAMRRAALIRQHNALIRKALANRNFPKSLLSEPGIWTVPDKACPYPYTPVVGETGRRSVDEEWLQYVPDDIKKDILTPAERSENSVHGISVVAR
ncbi:Hypothetical protein PHPALM_2645 [Phytophthora palmivora]|uniref:Uncharacterized protein n=1 Tax=Phytophthora palmivora TaxID=4796 RepID=A0A2P4YP96_9STRA|nr:Hypothetical protein PHPALM_2645 [Phytophthora palmivora]